MDRPDPDDPRDADVVDPTQAPEQVQPSATGTVVDEGTDDEEGPPE